MRRSHIACAAILAVSLAGSARAEEPVEKISVDVKFATQLDDRKPVDPGTAFQPGKLYCWTRVKGGSGEFRLVHVWLRDDRVVWRQPVRVRGRSWVTWSYHNVTPGHWKVQIEDTDGGVISQGSFTVAAPARASTDANAPDVTCL
jgi:hypothetical protein